MDRWLEKDSWAAELSEFTHRNAGRHTILEEDGVELGAQQAERDLPLRGVAFDPKDGRIEIMLGDQSSVEHLTRTVEGASEVGILRDDEGRDRALRIGHDDGQTLLRFV